MTRLNTTIQTTTTDPGVDNTISRHDRFMCMNYPRYPIVIERSEGCYLYGSDGREYLDLFAGFGAGLLGHCHPDLVRAVKEQSERVWHVGNLLHTEPQTRAAESIAKFGFGGRSFFCHSGADANEAAFKLARLYGRKKSGAGGPRHKIIAMQNSFHGRSFGTMVATGQTAVRDGFEPLLEGFEHVPFNYLDALDRAIDEQTVAVVTEPIQGEGGVNIPNDEYLPGMRRLCDEHDLLLICDEVWTGCGRTGRWFGYQHWPIEPDIMTLAKGVGGGLAVGVMCAKPDVAELYDCKKQGGVKHATTLGGNCLSMAVAAAIFDVIERDGLIDAANRLNKYTVDRLRQFAQSCPAISEVRGKGLFIGIELHTPTNGAGSVQATEVVKRCLEAGVMINGTKGNVVRIAPPLTITEKELSRGLDVLEKAVLTV